METTIHSGPFVFLKEGETRRVQLVAIHNLTAKCLILNTFYGFSIFQE